MPQKDTSTNKWCQHRATAENLVRYWCMSAHSAKSAGLLAVSKLVSRPGVVSPLADNVDPTICFTCDTNVVPFWVWVGTRRILPHTMRVSYCCTTYAAYCRYQGCKKKGRGRSEQSKKTKRLKNYDRVIISYDTRVYPQQPVWPALCGTRGEKNNSMPHVGGGVHAQIETRLSMRRASIEAAILRCKK